MTAAWFGRIIFGKNISMLRYFGRENVLRIRERTFDVQFNVKNISTRGIYIIILFVRASVLALEN